jgi:hypothetical protein
MYNSLYVTITDDSEFISDIFPQGIVWEMTDEDTNDDGSSVIRFEWSGEKRAEIEESLRQRHDVVGYQIL